MKNPAGLICLMLFTTCAFTQEKEKSDSLEVHVDGKHLLTVPKNEINSYSINIVLPKGRHEIKWLRRDMPGMVKQNENTISGPNAGVNTETIDPAFPDGFGDDSFSVYADGELVVCNQKLSSSSTSLVTSLLPVTALKEIRMEDRKDGQVAPDTSMAIITVNYNKSSINLHGDREHNAIDLTGNKADNR